MSFLFYLLLSLQKPFKDNTLTFYIWISGISLYTLSLSDFFNINVQGL